MAALLQSAKNQSASATTVTVNIGNSFGNGTVDTTPHSLLIAFVGSATVGRTCSASDNINGAYTTDQTSTSSCSICSFPNGAGGAITVTGAITSTATTLFVLVQEWSGIQTVSPFDKGASANATGVATLAVGPTATLTGGADLAVAMCALNANGTSSFAAQSPFTPDANSPLANASTFEMAVGYQILSSTSGPTCTFTWTNNTNPRGAIATYQTVPTSQIAPFYSRRYVLFNT